jgi:hypothetical protein
MIVNLVNPKTKTLGGKKMGNKNEKNGIER